MPALLLAINICYLADKNARLMEHAFGLAACSTLVCPHPRF
jgi:hypothetical protein